MLDQLFEDDDTHVPAIESSAVGIDLGTTNTVVAHATADKLAVLQSEQGDVLLPSVVAFLPSGKTTVGQSARERRMMDPAHTIFSAKRLIGQPYSSERIQRAIRALPYKVIEGKNQQPLIKTRGGTFSVQQISSLVVAKAKEIASSALQREGVSQPPTHCVVTVPANFNDAQREATRRAAVAGGLQVLRILNEPTAAALAYGHGRAINQRIAVFDMGGGTFDLSVLKVRKGLYEVLATGGDPFLGGDDMDYVLVEELADRFLRQHRIDTRDNPEAMAKLTMAAEHIKIQLSTEEESKICIEELAYGVGGIPISLQTTVTKSEFEVLIGPIVGGAIACAQSVLAQAGISPSQLDEVLLVGGATKVPLVRKRVSDFFGRAANGDIDPMQVVALGAAAHALTLFAPDVEITRTDLSRDELSEALSDLPTQIRPVAPPALLLDVTSHPIGLSTAGGFNEVLLPNNTQIPAEVTRTFGTAKDNQESVILKVCQGDDRRFENNDLLGELRLEGLRPAPRGKVHIEVGFLVNADGLLRVSAKDQETGAQTSATLSLFGLSEES